MKKLLSILAIQMMAMTAWAIEPVKPTVGNGKNGSPYEIGSAGNLVWFAQQVNGGATGIYGKLTADIDLGDDQTMIGTNYNKYNSTFDGDGHTVTVNYTAEGDYTALFRHVNVSKIKNLRTAGSISTGYQFAGGIVAGNWDTIEIENCVSSVTISSTFTEPKDGTHGGIVANNQCWVELTNVVFNGKMLGENATHCGGLIGWSEYSAKITNSLFCPSEMTFSESYDSESSTIFRGVGKVTNCYYTTTLGNPQGTATSAAAVASGEACYLLNGGKTDGTQGWYQNIDNNQPIDATPVPFKTHGTVYGGVNQCPAGTYSNTKKEHVIYGLGGAGFSHCTNSGCNYVIGTPAEKDASGIYQITNKGNLIWFAQQVNAGETEIKGKLTADINLGDDQTMIGTSEYEYNSIFDGDGHTVTVNYSAEGDYTALFRFVSSSTIKNLKVRWYSWRYRGLKSG